MFAEKLENAVSSVKGGQALVLMGFDGLPVETFSSDEQFDVETVGMEFSVLLKEVRKAAEQLEAGTMREMTVRTDRLTAVMRVVNDEYFLAMAVEPSGNLGKARFVLRIIAPQIVGELV
ncbi:MAG: roadblock/LC7 domain-containing protein [Polyangia bacterium]